MKILNKYKKQMIYTATIAFIVVFSLNYVFGSCQKLTPEDLKSIFFKNENEDAADLSFLNEKQDIRVRATSKDESVVYIYDPSFYWYVNSSKIISNVSYRYFSEDDYKNKRDVSIYIFEIETLLNIRGSESWRKRILNLEKKYNTKIIHVFDPNSNVTEENEKVKIVKNLFSESENSLDIVKITPKEEFSASERRDLITEMEERGFIETEKKNSGIFETVKASLSSKVYSKMFGLTLILSYLSYVIFLFIINKEILKEAKILFISGATKKEIIWTMVRNYILPNLAICFITTVLSYLYLKYIGELSLMRENFLKIVLILFLTNLVISFLRTAEGLSKIKRGDLYD